MNSKVRKTAPFCHLFVGSPHSRTLLKEGDFYSYHFHWVLKSPPISPYIVKLYAKIILLYPPVPFPCRKKLPPFSPSFAVFSAFFAEKKALRPPWNKKPFLSFFISVLFFPQAPSKTLLPCGLQMAKVRAFLPISPKGPPATHNIRPS